MNLEQTLMVTLFNHLPKDLCLKKINQPHSELIILSS